MADNMISLIIRKCRGTGLIVFVAIIKILAYILFRKNSDRIWLIGCGGNRWGDNADALWKYLTANQPQIKAYAVVKKRTDIGCGQGNIIKRSSLLNYLLILQAEALVTSHSISDVGPEIITSETNARRVWLQHGVTGIKEMIVAESKLNRFDLICVSSNIEKELIVASVQIKPEKLNITGLARHDALKELSGKVSRQGILYMPTIRDWATTEDVEYFEHKLFSWVNLYNENDYPVNVYLWLHPNWYRKDFSFSKVDGFIYVDLKEDLQSLLLQSELLITDYSSVAFDAALSGIPTIFYQPDQEMFYQRRGVYKAFFEQNDTLVVKDDHELVEVTNKLLVDNRLYQDRVKADLKWAFRYVETYDGQCCFRIYRETAKLIKSGRERVMSH